MRLNPGSTADVLKAFIQEDRTETRIYRARIQNISYSLALASFAMSAFFMGNVHLGAPQLRNITLLIDLGLVAVMLIFFGRTRRDLVLLRKAMKARQDLLLGLRQEEMQDINPFPAVKEVKPDITDSDLYWTVALSVVVVLVKMSVLAIGAASFVLPQAIR